MKMLMSKEIKAVLRKYAWIEKVVYQGPVYLLNDDRVLFYDVDIYDKEDVHYIWNFREFKRPAYDNLKRIGSIFRKYNAPIGTTIRI